MYILAEWITFWLSFLASYVSVNQKVIDWFITAHGCLTRKGKYIYHEDRRPLNSGDARAGK